jgi:vitamin B12 transporter
VDAGVRVGVKSWRTELDVTGFFHGYQDLIVYEPSGFTPDGIPDYRNGGEAEAYGVEVEARARPTPRLMLRAAVTWMETEATDDLDNPSVSFSEGEPLVRRPTWLGSLSANVKPIDRLALQAALYYVGDRDDLDFNQFPTSRVENEAYTRLDLSLRARLIDRLFLIGRMQNVLDEEYEEIFGFRAQGQFWYGGLEYRHRF